MLSKDIFLNYLLEISEKIKRSPRNSQTRPMHGPAIKLLNNLLKQALVGSSFSGMNIVCVDLFIICAVCHKTCNDSTNPFPTTIQNSCMDESFQDYSIESQPQNAELGRFFTCFGMITINHRKFHQNLRLCVNN